MSDDFDGILDRCLADIHAGHDTLDSCLQHYPAQAGRLAALLRAAQLVSMAPRPAPLPADKRRALESRLLRQASQSSLKPAQWVAAPRRVAAPRALLWRRGVVLAAASFMVVLLLFGTAVGASAASVPGDLLYPVKRAAEQVRLALTPDQERVDVHLEFAWRRLQELQVLAERGEVSKDLLADISGETTAVLDRVTALPQDGQRTVLAALTAFQDQHLQVLEKLASSAQGETEAEVMAALADSTTKRELVTKLLAGAASDNTPGGSSEQPPAILEGTQPAPGKAAPGQPATKPDTVGTPEAPDAPAATRESPANPQESTPKAEHTPPGQAKQSTPHSPPGQAKPPSPHTQLEKPTKVPAK